jgi:hypothetical protein
MSDPKRHGDNEPDIPGGFVAGTLVHTKHGLRPIEQIKVGAWVLSKPDSGNGEPSYKRVTSTFEYDEREVWFINYRPVEIASGDLALEKMGSEEYMVVTSGNPIWVSAVRDFRKYEVLEEVSEWARADSLLEYLVNGRRPFFEIQDGRLAAVDFASPVVLLATPATDQGAVVILPGLYETGTPSGTSIDFSQGFPRTPKYHGRVDLVEFLEVARDESIIGTDRTSIAYLTDGCLPLLRKVYNIEVEVNHTFFVGNSGVCVHNIKDKKRIVPENSN